MKKNSLLEFYYNKNYLKNYILLLEHKPLKQRDLVNNIANSFSSLIKKDRYFDKCLNKVVKFTKENYDHIRIYSKIYFNFINKNTNNWSTFLDEDDDSWNKLTLSHNVRNFVDIELSYLVNLFRKHKHRVWACLSHNDRNRILLGNVDESTLEGQYEFSLTKKLLPLDTHNKVTKSEKHGKKIHENENWTFIIPKTLLGSIAWATSYHDGSKETIRTDLKDKVSWCTSSLGDNWFVDISDHHLLVYCIQKNYKKNDIYRKITIGFDLKKVCSDNLHIDYNNDVTQDSNNDPVEDVKDIIDEITIQKIKDEVKKYAILELGLFSTDIVKGIQKKLHAIMDNEESYDFEERDSKLSKSVREILTNYFDDITVSNLEKEALKSYLIKDLSRLLDYKDKVYFLNKYDIDILDDDEVQY